MLRWTLKLKEVLNKLILSASVPEAAVLPVLLLLVLGMLVVLVVLMVLVVLVVLEELVVFEGEIFKRSISLKKQILEFKKKNCVANKSKKVLRTKSKIHLYFRVLHSIMPL